MHFHWSSFDIAIVVHWLSSRYIFSILCHLIKSWGNISFSSFKEVWICLVWGLLIKNDCVDFSNSEINSLSEFVLIVNLDPFFNKSSWKVLNILRNFEGSKLFLLDYLIVFSCFWWLTKLRSVWCFLCHLPEIKNACGRAPRRLVLVFL